MSVIPIFGYEATRDLQFLSLNVIIHILCPVAFIVSIVKVSVHWFLAHKSCILNEHEGKLSLSVTKNYLSLFSLLPFCISTFLLFPLHHHYISFVLTFGVNVFLHFSMRFLKKKGVTGSYHITHVLILLLIDINVL